MFQDEAELRVKTERGVEWVDIPPLVMNMNRTSETPEHLANMIARACSNVVEVRWNWYTPYGLGQGHYIPGPAIVEV